ncbi:MAG: FHA domain-containing protein [Lentisphaeria bacterium]|nr:FHA domain-containing protein [Lentisphaeria bacterium]
MPKTPRFTVLHEKFRGKTFDLDKDVISIGRTDTMDICIKDPSISGHHADLIKSERDGRIVYTLRDNDSSNGTRVNNVPITEQELKSSDLILFGMVEVLYDCDSGAEAEADSFTTTTHTIDLSSIDSNLSSVPNVASMDPFAAVEKKRHILVSRILIGVAALLVLAGIVVAILAAMKVVNPAS